MCFVLRPIKCVSFRCLLCYMREVSSELISESLRSYSFFVCVVSLLFCVVSLLFLLSDELRQQLVCFVHFAFWNVVFVGLQNDVGEC